MRALPPVAAALLTLCAVGCSSSDPPSRRPDAASPADAKGPPAGRDAGWGSTDGAAGQTFADASPGASDDAAPGSTAADARVSDAASTPDGRVPDGAPPAGAFACTQFMGPNVTGEWFAAGFETFVDNARYQVKAPHRSFVEDWANPGHAVWRESMCDSTFRDCDTRSRCANGGAPDRIVFVTQTGDYLGTSQKAWEDSIKKAIATIKVKYPTVKQVELLTFVRGPQNANCGKETTVSAALDAAHAALAASSGGTITAGPRFSVNNCNLFKSPPHFSPDGNKAVAEMVGKHYAQTP
jgi:hypothetical protein